SSTCKRYEYFYYACLHRAPVDTGRTSRCTAKRVRAEELDGVVWDAIRAWVQSPEMLQQEVQAWQTSRQAASNISKEVARLEATHHQLELQLDRLLDAYQRGAMSVEQLKARRERLDAAMAAARMRGEDLAAQQVDSTRVTRIAKDIAVFAATLRHGIDALNFTERQRLVRLLLERVVVAGDNLTIEHAIPLSGRFGGLRQGSRCRFPPGQGGAPRAPTPGAPGHRRPGRAPPHWPPDDRSVPGWPAPRRGGRALAPPIEEGDRPPHRRDRPLAGGAAPHRPRRPRSSPAEADARDREGLRRTRAELTRGGSTGGLDRAAAVCGHSHGRRSRRSRTGTRPRRSRTSTRPRGSRTGARPRGGRTGTRPRGGRTGTRPRGCRTGA